MNSRTRNFVVLIVLALSKTTYAENANDASIREAVTFYASFDKEIRADFGKGVNRPSTRFTKDRKQRIYEIRPRADDNKFRIAKRKGVRGGALHVTGVLPNSGRLFFPLKGHIGFKKTGWSGSLSVWINTNPDTMLKTRYCDPVQITERGATDGGIWFDFTPDKPRDMRMGVFKALRSGQKAVSSKSPNAPIVVVKDVGFKSGDWHHIVLTWRDFDTGKSNARATLYVDGRVVGTLKNREIAMKWNLEKSGLYVGVNYIGLMDELALFDRELTGIEIKRLHQRPQIFESLTPSK